MKPAVFLTDTTLRDGGAAAGFWVFPLATKLSLLHALEDAGIWQLDAGIPAAGTQAKDTLRRMMAERKRIRISAWNRMRLSDIRDALEVEPDVIHISVPASDRLIRRVLGKDPPWVEQTLKSCISLAREHGFPVTVGLQDASRAELPFMLRLASIAHNLGATALKLADTVGMLTPSQARVLVSHLKESGIALGIHTHNDLGMAVPIAIESALAGVTHVDVTCFGIGERAGNCDLFSFAEYGTPSFLLPRRLKTPMG